MSKTDIWMPLYVADYLADTARLSTVEHGAYLLLLMEYWRKGPLPDDDKILANIARADRRTWEKDIGPAVREFFTLGQDGFLHQKRVEEERQKALDLSAKRRAAAQQRGTKSTSKPDAIAEQLDEQLLNKPPDVDSALQASLSRDTSPSPSQEPSLADSDSEATRTFGGREEHVVICEGRRSVGGFYLDPVKDLVYEAARIDNARWRGVDGALIEWMADHIEPDTIVAAIEKVANRPKYKVPSTLAYFDRMVRDEHANKPRERH